MIEVTQEILNYGWTSFQLALLHTKWLPTVAKHNFISSSNERGLVQESFVGILLSTNRRFFGWASPNSNCCCFQTEASYRTKGPKLAEEPRFFNWTTLHKNFLGAPTLLLGSSSKIQKQFKMKADFFQNLKALSYSESCPPVGCLYQYIEKGKNLSLCANYRFSGDEQNT